MTQGVYGWSKTAASNASADSSFTWAEGMPPSSVNDSARAMMARLAEYRDDIAGSIVTGGSSTSYTVASNEVFDSLAHLNGQLVAFTPHTTNGATVTLNVDGLGAKALRYGPSLELQSGMLIQGSPYIAIYNNSDSSFYLRNFVGNPYGIPLGGMLPYIGSSAPNTAFALPFGQAISRTTFGTLFSLVGTTFGTGDGSTTFNIPDIRGRAVFGLDNMGGSAASRITVAGGNFDGTTLGTAGGSQNHVLTQAELPAVPPSFSTPPQYGAPNPLTFGAQGGPTAEIGLGSPTTTVQSTTGTVFNNLGSGNAHTNMPPAIVLPYILRVI